jgi:hypothetical protein
MRGEGARHGPPMVPFGGADEGPLGERQETWMDRAVRSPREEFRCTREFASWGVR